jgi:hypothetical protein
VLEWMKMCVLEGETARVGKKYWSGSKSACWRGKLPEGGRSTGVVAKVRAGGGNWWSGEEVLEW